MTRDATVTSASGELDGEFGEHAAKIIQKMLQVDTVSLGEMLFVGKRADSVRSHAHTHTKGRGQCASHAEWLGSARQNAQ